MLSARAAVRTLKEYHPPLGGREGLRLDFNENTVGCSPRVLEALRNLDPERLAKYPEREPVEQAVAEFLGIAPAQVLLTNGVDEGIHLLCETYLESGDEVIVAVPTFSMYEIYAAATGARVITVLAKEDFAFPTAEVLARITGRTRLIAFANPNNPTGRAASREDLLKIAAAAPDAALLVDEAYFDFYGQTVLDAASTAPNLFVARTFSKAYGLAGLRIGVLAGAAEQMKMVRRVSSPYNVNGVALACLPAALADREYIRDYVAEVGHGRERLEKELAELSVRYWPSQANFVLALIGAESGRFVGAMRERGILVRDRSSDPGCQGCVRMTLGSREQTDRLIAALRAVMAELKSAKVSA
ncbi:MAG TPA: histidinol-phosphate transaminase [Terriglobales bacterium]|nr:histidinol-phosphate transaminase [Terriglobales bacterium]